MLAKYAKELATEKRKQEQRKRKDAAATAAATAHSKTGSKRAPATPGKPARKASIPRKKVITRTIKTRRTAPSKKQADLAAPATGIDVAATVSSTRSRSGRTVTMPARFEE